MTIYLEEFGLSPLPRPDARLVNAAGLTRPIASPFWKEAKNEYTEGLSWMGKI
jgi:hypothetical protein